MSYDEQNVFARILRGDIPSAKVYEDELTVAFMDAGQVNPGHVIVAVKTPRATLLDLTEDEAAALFRTTHRVAKAVDAAFKPEGMTLLQANKPAGFQTVPHFHIHVLPRNVGDGVELEWPRKEPPFAELEALAARIKVPD